MTPIRRVESTHLALLLAVTFVFTGCWELQRQVVVNPDGSAKVRVSVEMPADLFQQMQAGEETDLEAAAREQAANMVQTVQGVEAWSDMEWSAGSETVRVAGTAYVPDLAEFGLADSSGSGDAVTTLDVRRGDGSYTLELTFSDQNTEDEEPLPSPLTDEQAMEHARQAKQEGRETRRTAATLFTGMTEGVVLQLPAEPASTTGFTRQEDGTYAATFEGETLLSAIASITEMSDEQLADHLQQAAGKGEKSREEVMRNLVQERLEGMPARLVVPASGEPQFDYEAEVAAASKSFRQLKARLGIEGQDR